MPAGISRLPARSRTSPRCTTTSRSSTCPIPSRRLRHARKLPPAHRLVWEAGRITIERYWELSYEPKWKTPEPELREQVRAKITEAVRIRLMSDVPLGAHLSGGIDSGDHRRPDGRDERPAGEDVFHRLQGSRFQRTRSRARRGREIPAPSTTNSSSSPRRSKFCRNSSSISTSPSPMPRRFPTWYLAQMTRAARHRRAQWRRRRRSLRRLPALLRRSAGRSLSPRSRARCGTACSTACSARCRCKAGGRSRAASSRRCSTSRAPRICRSARASCAGVRFSPRRKSARSIPRKCGARSTLAPSHALLEESFRTRARHARGSTAR